MRYDLLHPKALRTALIKHVGDEARPPKEKVVPTERQVRRWISGDTPWPGWARKATDEVLGITEEAAPSMTRRLLAGIIALENKSEVSEEDRTTALREAEEFESQAAEMDVEIGSDLERSSRPRGGRTKGQAGGLSGGSLGSKRQGP